MVSNSSCSTATRPALLAGASLGALAPPPGLPPPERAEALLDALLLAEALLAEASLGEASLGEELLDDALLDEALLAEALLDDEALLEAAVFSSSEKSMSCGGCFWLRVFGSGGSCEYSGSRSASLGEGVAGLRLRWPGSEAPPRELLVLCRDSSPPPEAVLSRPDWSPELMVGMELLGCGLELPGMPWLELGEGGLGMPVLGDWLLLGLDELLDDEELDED